MTEDLDTIDSLTDEYTAWNKAQGLDLGSADEHMFDESLTEEQRQWVHDFCARWEEAEARDRDARDAEREAAKVVVPALTIHKGRLETRNFTFEVYGSTDAEARRLMKAALAEHGRQYKLTAIWDAEFEDEIVFEEITLGSAYRDRHLMEKVR